MNFERCHWPFRATRYRFLTRPESLKTTSFAKLLTYQKIMNDYSRWWKRKSKNFDDTKYLLFLIEPTVCLNFICLKVTFDLKKKIIFQINRNLNVRNLLTWKCLWIATWPLNVPWNVFPVNIPCFHLTVVFANGIAVLANFVVIFSYSWLTFFCPLGRFYFSEKNTSANKWNEVQ